MTKTNKKPPNSETSEHPSAGPSQNSANPNVRPGAIIKVIGVGGGGTNAINTMIDSGIECVEFIAANTDLQSLKKSLSPTTIQVGKELTKGLGAGANPDIGRDATLEDRHEIMEAIGDADMVFVTAGMGGGTGTGGASVVAQIARELGALTVGVVTQPFAFEGRRRSKHAEIGIERLREHVDTLIVIPNQKLLSLATPDMSLIEAFKLVDKVLLDAVRGISDIINIPGTINVDFADVKTVMSQMGRALMGIGFAEGEKRAVQAASQAISSPLLDDIDIEGATGVLINVTAGPDVGILELNEACSVIHEAAHEDANIIMGAVIDENMQQSIRVTVIATGFAGRDDVAGETTRDMFIPKQKKVLANITAKQRGQSFSPSFAPTIPQTSISQPLTQNSTTSKEHVTPPQEKQPQEPYNQASNIDFSILEKDASPAKTSIPITPQKPKDIAEDIPVQATANTNPSEIAITSPATDAESPTALQAKNTPAYIDSPPDLARAGASAFAKTDKSLTENLDDTHLPSAMDDIPIPSFQPIINPKTNNPPPHTEPTAPPSPDHLDYLNSTLKTAGTPTKPVEPVKEENYSDIAHKTNPQSNQAEAPQASEDEAISVETLTADIEQSIDSAVFDATAAQSTEKNFGANTNDDLDIPTFLRGQMGKSSNDPKA